MEKLFWEIFKSCRKASTVTLCYCKILGLESATLLKQDSFKVAFLGIFQKFPEWLLKRISARRRKYFTKKVLSINSLQVYWKKVSAKEAVMWILRNVSDHRLAK